MPWILWSSPTFKDAGAFKVTISIPSAIAPSISPGSAVISFLRLLYKMLTFFAPSRFAVRTASMDTFPPPMTTTSFPVRSMISSFPTLRRNCTAERMPSASSPGSPSFLSVLAPIVMSTASYCSRSSWIVMSTPIFKPYFTSTPVFKIALISSSSRSFGRR